MSGEVNNLNIGKQGQIKLNADKGVQKSAFGENEVSKSIFEHYDKDKNGILDEKELNQMYTDLDNAAQSKVKNDSLGRREARNYLKGIGVESDDARAAIKAFMDVLGSGADNVESAVLLEDGTIGVKWDTPGGGGTSEIYSQADGQNPSVRLQRTEIQNGKTTTTDYESDGETPSLVSEEYADGTLVESKYLDGEIAEKTKTQGQTVTELDFNNNDRPIKITSGDTTKTFEYDSAGNTVKTVLTTPGKVVTTEVNGESRLVTTQNLDANGNVTSEIFEGTDSEGIEFKITNQLKDGKKLSQTMTVGEETYSVEYDGNGNTKGVIVQNGESPAAIAKKFNCTVEDLIAANPEVVKGKAPKQYFLVGSEVKIPGEIRADEFAKMNAGRGDKASQVGIYREQEMARVAERLEGRRTKEITLEKNYKNWTEYAKEMLKNEGIERPTQAQIVERTNQLVSLNPGVSVPKAGNKITVTMTEEEILREDAMKANAAQADENAAAIAQIRADRIAQKAFDIVDNNHGNSSMRQLQKLFNEEVSPKNVVAFLDAYEARSANGKTASDTSIIDSIMSEGGNKYHVLKTLMDNLTKAAKNAGVADSDIAAATGHFWSSYTGVGSENQLTSNKVKNMEKSVDFLRGAITAAQNGGQSVSFADAMKMTAAEYKQTISEASQNFESARKEEGWIARFGDGIAWAVTGGSTNTVHRMRKQLGAQGVVIEQLEAAQKAGDEAKFKQIWKENFGVEFDPGKIAARNKMQQKIENVESLQSAINLTNGLIGSAKNVEDAQFMALVKDKLGWSQEILDQALVYGRKNYPSLSDKEILVQTLQNSVTVARTQMLEQMGGKSLEQMENDMLLLNQSVYGTTDIGKDIAEFNQNMVMTEEITKAGLEIAAMLAIEAATYGMASPLVAPRMAAIGVKFGTRGLKIANGVNRGVKTVNTANKGKTIASGTKAAKVANTAIQYGTHGASAFVATATVDLSNGDEVKATLKKSLMNAAFAGAGAGSSQLAPILSKSCGLSNKIATECAEQIINLAGDAGISVAFGADFTQNDAFIDLAVGVIMSRIAHIKGGKVQSQPKPQSQPQSKTPVLDKAVSLDNSGNMQAPGSVGKLNPKKAEQVRQEVVGAALDPHSTPEQLAQVHQELDVVGGPGNRALRREGQQVLEQGADIADALEPGFRAGFDQAKHNNLRKEIDRLFSPESKAYNSMLSETNIRNIKEYVANVDDVTELDRLTQLINAKNTRRGGGGIAARNGYDGYNDLMKAIDNRRAKIDAPAVQTPDAQPVKLTKAQAKQFREMNTEFNKIASMKQGEETFAKFSELKTRIEAMPDCKQKTEMLANVNERLEGLSKKGFGKSVPVAPMAEAPKAEAPKAEAPKAEAPMAEAPKAEAPKAEAPMAEAPKAEAPKAEAPMAEAPKAEAPKAETPAATPQAVQVKEGNLTKNVPSTVEADARLMLGNQFELNLADPKIKAKLDALKEGETLTVGRAGDIEVPNSKSYARVSRKHLEITKQNGQIVVKDVSTNGTKVKGASTNQPTHKPLKQKIKEQVVPDELVRNAGNGGKAIDVAYIKASQDLRNYFDDAIISGNYAESPEQYIATMRRAHEVAYGGIDGSSAGWYERIGEGLMDVNPGQIRDKGRVGSNRYKESQFVENIAQRYGDGFKADGNSLVQLPGISYNALTAWQNGRLNYPDGAYLNEYFTQMQRTAKQATQLIENGASQREILSKVAEHYQYCANARPFGQINNSLFMNEINTLLLKAGMKPMPHGMLDHAAQRLQPEAFQRYFMDEYYRTALN